MIRSLAFVALSFAILLFSGSSASAGTAQIVFNQSSDLSNPTMQNTGGLDLGGGQTIANGAVELNFLVPFAGQAPGSPASTFEASVTVSGFRTFDFDPEVAVDASGAVVLGDNEVNELLFTVTAINETSGNGSTAVYDGIFSASFSSTNDISDANIGASTFGGGTNVEIGNTNGVITTFTTTGGIPILSAPDESLIISNAGLFSLADVGLQFTVSAPTTAVPEPSSLAFLGLAGVVCLTRCRRKIG